MRMVFCGIVFVWVICILFAAASRGVGFSDQYMDYPNGEDTYAVVYIDTQNSASYEDAKKKATQRAAEITVQNGYRYFHIDSEGPVMVAQAGGNSYAPPGDLYQELIVRQGETPTPFQRDQTQTTSAGIYSAYKLVIHCYETKPAESAIDACTLTDCSKR